MVIKKFTRYFASNAISIVAASQIVEGFKLSLDINTIAIAAVVLSLVNVIIKPLLKIISFPINIATLGFFTIVINALLLYLTVYLVDGLKLTSGIFALNYPELGIIIPNIQLTWLWSLAFASISINIVNWILKKILF